jgi:NADPH-dependent glutamate synthase beta subunit-like oxidoreductase
MKAPLSSTSRDLTRPADLEHKRGTGPARSKRPEYIDLLPPCNAACPAGENIQSWLSLTQAGRYRDAWLKILDDNPLPAVHGRVCYHPCETSCNRTQLDESVSIHSVERFLGDLALAEGWTPQAGSPSGKRLLIVGAGPSGLSAAYHLARLGHAVEIRDGAAQAGGMMHFGIPAYRLPRAVLDAEVERIRQMGVRITLNHRVEDLAQEWTEGGFDAVFVAVGAHLSKRVDIPATDAVRMVDALSYLRDVDRGAPPRLGRRVAIYGGGNTAMDAARSALRLGHEPLIVYRRDYAHMPALPFEADEAMEEGVRIHWLRSIASIDGSTLKVEVMEIGADGKARGTGKYETLEADAVVLAVGQDADTRFLASVPGLALQPDGTLGVDQRMMTGRPGLFAGGDMVPAERSVTVAVGHGKKAARHIDAWLRQAAYQKPPLRGEATFDQLRLWFSRDVAQQVQVHAPLSARQSGFGEVVHGLTEPEALFEAKRCLSCGNCFECDACLGACPERAITKLGPGLRYRFDYDHCTGCAVCFEQCPSHAIQMFTEQGAPA